MYALSPPHPIGPGAGATTTDAGQVGNNGSNTAQCASVRSNRPVTAMVSTRLQENSLILDHRHAPAGVAVLSA